MIVIHEKTKIWRENGVAETLQTQIPASCLNLRGQRSPCKLSLSSFFHFSLLFLSLIFTSTISGKRTICYGKTPFFNPGFHFNYIQFLFDFSFFQLNNAFSTIFVLNLEAEAIRGRIWEEIEGIGI